MKKHIKPIRFNHTNVIHLFTDLILKVNQIVSWCNNANDEIYKKKGCVCVEGACAERETNLKIGLVRKTVALGQS